jgi:MFS family permease
MNQIKKFYLASFLKNQTYFIPIMVLFFQNLGLNYSQIFWIFTIGSVFSFIIEIPTGIFADMVGKRKSIIFSKLFIFISFVAFGLSFNFLTLLLANLLYELGKSFRSGTETAFVYDFLSENKNTPSYTEVKANQKFYARLSEAIGAGVGGFIAYRYGFNAVFFIASLPALVNFLQTLTWPHLKESQRKIKASIKGGVLFAKGALKEVFSSDVVRRIAFNTALFSASILALDKFIQPYMKNAGIELQYFGVIYSGFLLLVAFLVRHASKLQNRFGGTKVINLISPISLVATLVIAFIPGFAWWGVAFFFLAIVVENLRSPIVNDLFHSNVSSKNRATTGSILSLLKSSSNLAIFPLIGYFADSYSINIAIFAISAVLLLALLFFKVPKKAKE